jgi:hypothetical protein
MGTLLGLVLVGSGLPELFAGIGLLKLRPWGRLLALFVSVLSLPAFPLGTLLGGYGLWVLLSAQGAMYFQASGVGLTEVAVMAGAHLLRDEDRKPASPLASLAMAVLVLLAVGAGTVWWFSQKAPASTIGRAMEGIQVTTGGGGAKPSGAKASPPAQREPEAPAGDDTVYTFRDEKGVQHYVNGLERVPTHLRATAKRM